MTLADILIKLVFAAIDVPAITSKVILKTLTPPGKWIETPLNDFELLRPVKSSDLVQRSLAHVTDAIGATAGTCD